MGRGAFRGSLCGELAPYRTILYPYIERRNGYETRLDEAHWPAGVTLSQVAVVPFYDRTELIEETLGTLNTALGEEMLVTKANREKYVSLVVQRALDEAVEDQFTPFRHGFMTVCNLARLTCQQPMALIWKHGWKQPMKNSCHFKNVSLTRCWSVWRMAYNTLWKHGVNIKILSSLAIGMKL